jgi:exo-beta-1,3-glucanase (GH17 family)
VLRPLIPALTVLALAAPAASAAATDEATVAGRLPAPHVELASARIDDGKVRACAEVDWGRRGDGSVRVIAFSDGAPIATATRAGEREHTCVTLDAPGIDRPLRDNLVVEAQQIVDRDRDGAADRLGFDDAGPQRLAAKAPCDMSKLSAVTGLTTCRDWIVFPSPGLDDNAPASTIESQLRFLHQQGFRGIVTYTVGGTMSQVPRIARQVGFQKVLVGLWDPAAEIGRIAAIKDQIDGVIVGNEGVNRRYSIDQLEAWVRQLKSSYPNLAISATNEWYFYLPNNPIGPRLMALGDFVFPNLHAVWDNNPAQNGLFSANPILGVGFTKTNVDQYFRSSKLPVILKEAWWPSNATAGPGCALQPNAPPGNGWTSAPYSEAAQQRFYSGLVATGIKFVWAEPFDLDKPECKNPPPAGYGGLIGPYWGLWKSPGVPKAAVSVIDVGRY